ncbi:unnamed protein product, partial [Ectocarpus sp. 4 AP-2014]
RHGERPAESRRRRSRRARESKSRRTTARSREMQWLTAMVSSGAKTEKKPAPPALLQPSELAAGGSPVGDNTSAAAVEKQPSPEKRCGDARDEGRVVSGKGSESLSKPSQQPAATAAPAAPEVDGDEQQQQ